MKFLLSTLLFVCLSGNILAEDDFSATETKIKAALENDRRTEADTKRDRNRKATETLKFFGLRHDMTVLELLPGGGWYTNILGITGIRMPTLRQPNSPFLA